MTKLAEAIDAHKQGNYSKAERLYRKVIDRGENIASLAHAKQMLGVLRFQTGHLEVARRLIKQSTMINPKDDAGHYHYGVVLAALRLHIDAIEAFSSAIAINPDNVGAFNNRGVSLHQLERHEEAISDFEKAAQADPTMHEAHYNRANSLADLGRFADAVAAFDRVIELAPDYAYAHLNRGHALRRLDRHEAALAAYDKALEIAPKDIEVLISRGSVLVDLKRYGDAAETYDEVISRQRDNARAWLGKANALMMLGVWDGAMKAYSTAARLDPKSVDALIGCGNCLHEVGRDQEAIEAYDKALALKPDRAEAKFFKAFPVLALGDYEQGWKLYEERWLTKRFAAQRKFAMPSWRGEDLTGKTLLVWTEQGYGDMIQFVRFLPLIKGGTVLLMAPKPIAPVLQGDRHTVVVDGASLPPFDYHCPLLDLPGALGITLETLPADPYITPNSQKAADWSLWLGERQEGRPRVGLAWAGNPGFRSDRGRSLPLGALAPLFEVENVEWFSLMKDVRPEDSEALAALPLRDFSGQIVDFADTAALISQLDVVITTDNGAAHLAGAMGKPVWLLLQKYQDWRWLRDRTNSPWYPTMKIFRAPSIEALPLETLKAEIMAL